MTKLYIIRHAEAEGNLYRRIHGQYDSLVTETGHMQIEALQRRFEGVSIDAVYCSDLKRTRETARAIYEPKGLTPHLTPLLREVNMGVWEDRPWADIEREYPEQYLNYNKAPHLWEIEGGENFYALEERIMGALREIAAENDGRAVAVVTHGGAIRTVLCVLMGLPPERISEIRYCDNTAVTLLEYENDEFRLEYMNDNSHLPENMGSFQRQTWWKNKDLTDSTNMYFVPMNLERDGERYLEYYKDAWRTAHGTLEGFSDVYLDIARARAAKNPLAVCEAMRDGAHAGLLELDLERGADEGAGLIAFYYMAEPFRGRGLAVQLIGQATSVFRALGRKKLRLRVAEENVRAIGFYKKFGFRQTGVSDGALGKLIVMEKNIAVD